MFTGRKILDEVSMQELQQLREEGNTNAEIAYALDVSQNTIYRLLGPCPFTRRGHSAADKKPRRVKPVSPASQKALISVVEQTTKYNGKDMIYTVYNTMGMVHIAKRDADKPEQYDVASLERYITELCDVLKVLKGGVSDEN